MLNKTIATAGKPTPGIFGCDFRESLADCRLEILWSARFGAAQGVLHLAPHLLNGIEVRRVGWQEQGHGSCLLDKLEGQGVLVGGQVVHDDDIALAQRRTENLGNIGAEHLGVCRAVDGHAGRRTVQADGTDHGGGAPAPARCTGVHPLPAQGPTTQARHIGLGATLVYEDEPGRIKALLAPPPLPTGFGNVRAVLLTGTERLFLYERPILSRV